MPDVRPLLLCAEARDRAWFRARLRRPRWQVGSQTRGDLGRRMGWAFETALRTASPVLLCGSDVVDFTAEDLEDAFEQLEAGCDVVFGPAADGGYWLVGMHRTHAALFEDMPWGGAGVLARTIERARGLQVGLVRERHDLDRGRDLLRNSSGQRRRACSRSSSTT